MGFGCSVWTGVGCQELLFPTLCGLLVDAAGPPHAELPLAVDTAAVGSKGRRAVCLHLRPNVSPRPHHRPAAFPVPLVVFCEDFLSGALGE